jgi:diguanylate cyclase (GGDEF)-like protein
MALRTRIALTFLLLLSAVLAAALYAVSVANRSNAEREAHRQLEVGALVFTRLLDSNQRLLTQAASAVADDYGFREAVSVHDTPTLVSALENAGARVGAALVVLTTLDGEVIASSGSHLAAGARFPAAARAPHGALPSGPQVMVEDGRLYQLVTVSVRTPLPVARISMGFALDQAAAHELAVITGLGLTLAVGAPDHSRTVVSEQPGGTDLGTDVGGDVAVRRLELGAIGHETVTATLSRSLAEARAPFERLTRTLVLIAILGMAGFAWAAFGIARNITRPLQDLTRVVDRIRGGDYDVVLDKPRHEELGVLAEGLTHMQRAVRERDQSIRRLAFEDGLTGLMNRTAFVEALERTLAGGAGPESNLAVALINVDRFRRINEHLGYAVGDEILRTLGRRLTSLPEAPLAVARLAADQFAVLHRLASGRDVRTWGASLIEALAAPASIDAQPIDLSLTTGLALAGEGAGADDLLPRADLAVEAARRAKQPLALYDASLAPATRHQLSLLGELRRGLEEEQLELYFQPKVELASGRVAGAEVLLRWQHPTRGLLSPAAFIPFAEQTGFVRHLTRWTLERAVARAAEWHRSGRPLALAVNIAADDLADEHFDSRIAALLTQHRLPPSLLTLELTESGFIEDPKRAMRLLESLATLGVKLSIDDFGTGYSSLSLLARLPVHEMKIDRSFVLALESDPEFLAVVRSAIDMGHHLGLQVVAEGIETPSAAERLRGLSCDIGQGYLFARPMRADNLAIWLAGRELPTMRPQSIELTDAAPRLLARRP